MFTDLNLNTLENKRKYHRLQCMHLLGLSQPPHSKKNSPGFKIKTKQTNFIQQLPTNNTRPSDQSFFLQKSTIVDWSNFNE